VAQYYQWFLDVEFMVFLGFGGLMTFLRRYSYSAIAFNYLISAFVILCARPDVDYGGLAIVLPHHRLETAHLCVNHDGRCAQSLPAPLKALRLQRRHDCIRGRCRWSGCSARF
jgi:hypothetical protein